MKPYLSPATFVAACLFGALSAYLAHRRHQNPYKWFAIGFLFGMFGLFALFFFPRRKTPVSPIPEEKPLPAIVGPFDKLWYYLDVAHEQQGPMSHNALTRAFREGKISLGTYVWNEELPDWKPLQELVKEEGVTSSP